MGFLIGYRPNFYMSILKGSDDGVLQSGLVCFWTLSIVWYSKKYTVFRKMDLFSSSGVGKRGTYSVGPV
jgi:hypothetical protein